MNRQLLSIFLPFLILFSLQGQSAENKVKLALNWKAEPQFGGFYQAKQDGSYAAQSLNVEILEGGSGTPTVQMLANDKVDFAIVSGEEILINNDRDPKHKVVGLFAVFQTNPQMIMCHPESGFHHLADVFSSTATLSMQSGLTYAQFLKKKYPHGKAKIVPDLGGITTFLTNKNFCQQGFATSEPLTAEKAGAKCQVFLVADEGFNPYTTVLAVAAQTIKTNPELVKKMTLAVAKGWQNYLTNPDSTDQVMAQINKSMDADTFRKSALLQKPLIQPANGALGTMSDSRWTELIQQLKTLKVIHQDLKASEQYKNL